MAKSIVGMMTRQGAGDFDPREFIAKYEDAYLKKGNRSGFKTKKSFSPSTLGYSHGTCPRYWYIAFSGADFIENIDSRALSNMENGSFTHERIQANIENMGILREKELEVINQDPPIRGFIDVVVDWNGKLVPGEIKSANDNSFQFRVTSGKPSPSHFVQFLIYLVLTDSEEGFLLYENKNTQEIAIIPVYMDSKNREVADYLFDWMRVTFKAFDEKTLPTRPWVRKNAKVCSTCPVKKDCFEKFGEGEVTLDVLEVPKP